jgi:phenylalanyl-tRNA synthetase beta chain
VKVTYTWLKDYVPLPVSPEEAAATLTQLGIEVEALLPVRRDLAHVVVGKVERVEPLNGSPALKKCAVAVGTTSVTVVCGAPNVRPGLLVAVALPGATLPGGARIAAREFGDTVSQGMICSEQELGLSERGDLIMTLGDDVRVGQGLAQVVPTEDCVFELNVTPNRPDCLSAIGVARELAAKYRLPLTVPAVHVAEGEKATEERIAIDVRDLENCPRYSARFIDNVKPGPSPWWLAARLHSVGMRSINNIVDITNYVMVETGQPLHAFDYDLLEKERIEVRRARSGEEFITLDGRLHQLREDTLLICDGVKPVAIAGVMGGLNSEVSDRTARVLLESAYFTPQSIRRTSKALGISTESSQRFERGVDPNGVLYASDRAAQLMAELCGATVARGAVDVYPTPIEPRKLQLRVPRVRQVLGAEIPLQECASILSGLGAEVEAKGQSLYVQVPTFRPDLEREIDLIEEVARVWSYDRIPARVTAPVDCSRPQVIADAVVEKGRECLIDLGYYEACTISLLSPRQALHFADEQQLVRLKNPLNEEYAALRPSMIPGLLQVVAHNLNRGVTSVRAFEIGRCFGATGDGYREWKALGMVLVGLVRPRSWAGEHREANLFDAKGQLSVLFETWRLPTAEFAPGNWQVCSRGGLEVCINKEVVARFGAVREEVLRAFDIERGEVFVAEVHLPTVAAHALTPVVYRPVPKFPYAPRDLSVVVDQHVPAEDLVRAIRESGGTFLRGVQVVDLYAGKQIPQGKKSLTFSLVFQDETRTLRDVEVDEAMRRIIEGLRAQTGAVLRS